MKLDFFLFRESLLVWNQVVIFCNSWVVHELSIVCPSFIPARSIAHANMSSPSLLKWLILIISACHSYVNDMKLGQYRSRSGRSVDTAKSSSGPRRFAAGRFLGHVDANRTLANSTLESGSRPEQLWTRMVTTLRPIEITIMLRKDMTYRPYGHIPS